VWNVERDASNYWAALPPHEKTAQLTVRPAYWDVVQDQLDGETNVGSENALCNLFNIAFRLPHNTAIVGSADEHADIRLEGTVDPQPLSNSDFFMMHNDVLCGLIELKTWWKVTDGEIDQVRQGNPPKSLLTTRHCAQKWHPPWQISNRANIRLYVL